MYIQRLPPLPKYIVLLGPCIAQHQMAIAQHPATVWGPGCHSVGVLLGGRTSGYGPPDSKQIPAVNPRTHRVVSA